MINFYLLLHNCLLHTDLKPDISTELHPGQNANGLSWQNLTAFSLPSPTTHALIPSIPFLNIVLLILPLPGGFSFG